MVPPGQPRLSAKARQFIDNTAAVGGAIALSTVSLAEIVYLIEKDRLAASAYDDLINANFMRSTGHVLAHMR